MTEMTQGEREAKIEQAFMSPDQAKVFSIFVHLGRERTLPKLLSALKEAEIVVSEATLKRWSSKFKWTDLATRTDYEIANRIIDEALPLHVHDLQRDLDIIEKLKESFYKRVENNEIKIELADYIILLKTQALIVGNPTERREIINTEKNEVTIHMTDEQMAEMMRLDAALKHNLPQITTYEQPDESE